jgi:hypothetical protein
MTDMRDHLADIVEAAIDSVHDLDVTHRDYAEASADAIIAAIKPLPSRSRLRRSWQPSA